jgi:anti-anti-sigma factor
MSPPGRMHTLVLMGELDRCSAHTLEAEIERLEGATSAITLDLSKLTHIDSTGVAVIAFRSGLCERRGYGVALIRGPWFIQREFELAGLGDRLPFEGVSPNGVPAAGGCIAPPAVERRAKHGRDGARADGQHRARLLARSRSCGCGRARGARRSRSGVAVARAGMRYGRTCVHAPLGVAAASARL